MSGTVTYHYKEYRAGSDHPWCIWFTADAALDDDAAVRFTAAEGRAMGLTPPAPAPLVVTCNGHSIELSDEEADVVVDLWADYADVRDPNAELRCKTKLAGLLRDARQDPQPTADTRHADGCQSDLPLSMCQCDLPTARPEQDDTPGIDFDALPIGTVLKTYNGYYVTKGGNGNWFSSEEALAEPDHLLAPYTVVYQPAPLSPQQ